MTSPRLTLLHNHPPTAHLTPRHTCENAVTCDRCLRDLASVLAQDLAAGLTLPRDTKTLLIRALNKPVEWYRAQVSDEYSVSRCYELRAMVVGICDPDSADCSVADFSEADFYPVPDSPRVARLRPWWDFFAHPLRTLGRVVGGAR